MHLTHPRSIRSAIPIQFLIQNHFVHNDVSGEFQAMIHAISYSI